MSIPTPPINMKIEMLVGSLDIPERLEGNKHLSVEDIYITLEISRASIGTVYVGVSRTGYWTDERMNSAGIRVHNDRDMIKSAIRRLLRYYL